MTITLSERARQLDCRIEEREHLSEYVARYRASGKPMEILALILLDMAYLVLEDQTMTPRNDADGPPQFGRLIPASDKQ